MDLQFGDSHISEICRFGIADWVQQFEDLKQHLRAHLCKFATGVNGTGSKFAAGVNNIVGKLSLVSTTLAVNL
jgi:hypothetical protein